MKHTGRVVWNIACTAEIAVSLWQFLRAWWMEDGRVTENLGLDPGFAMGLYAGLIIAGLMGLVVLNWALLQRVLPANKFAALQPDLDRLVSQLDPLKAMMSGNATARCEVMQQRLAKLGIDSPPSNNSEAWREFTLYMQAYSEGRLLSEARQYWPTHKPKSRRRRGQS